MNVYPEISNIGAGSGEVFKQKTSDNNSEFRTIKSGAGIIVTNNTDEIEIKSSQEFGEMFISPRDFASTTRSPYNAITDDPATAKSISLSGAGLNWAVPGSYFPNGNYVTFGMRKIPMDYKDGTPFKSQIYWSTDSYNTTDQFNWAVGLTAVDCNVSYSTVQMILTDILSISSGYLKHNCTTETDIVANVNPTKGKSLGIMLVRKNDVITESAVFLGLRIRYEKE